MKHALQILIQIQGFMILHQEFLGRVEWKGGGFGRFRDFLEESESVSSLIISPVQGLSTTSPQC